MAGEDEQAAEHTWRKTETWAARSRYQKGIEGRSRSQAMPPTAPATRLRTISGAADDEVDLAAIGLIFRPKGSGFRLLMRKITM